jgi:Predicted membrane protein (DUF2157)
MNPDVASAIERLQAAGTLRPEIAGRLSRVARRELVSLHAELRLVAYLGVLLVMGGVGILVHDNLDRIGPLGIASALALAAVACFVWVVRQAPPFTWDEVPSPHLALDYVLLLGALLTAADLAYVEAKFTPLGDAWTWHLLVVAIFYLLLAFRFDSRVLLSLALTTFAAWRGVSAARLEGAMWRSGQDMVRINAMACGILFVIAGVVLRARSRKAHFEPVAVHLGWLLILGSIASALFESMGAAWALLLIVVSGGLLTLGYVQRRFSLIAFAIVAAYVGVSALVLRLIHDWAGGVFWFAFTPLMVVGVLFAAHHYLPEPE